MSPPRPIVIDTDGGIDDAAAIWWALTDPGLDVVAITVVAGNVGRELAARNVLAVLEAAGRPDVPVALGEAGPIGPAPAPRDASAVHGKNGLGDIVTPVPSIEPVAESAGDLLRRVVGERPGEITLVTIGPLSTVGRLVSVDPEFAQAVGALVVMGGSITVDGLDLPAVEANIRHDPRAAQAVVDARWSAPPLLVPLNVTLAATFGDEEFSALAEGDTAAAAFLDEPLRFYRRARGGGDCPCHDLLAVVTVVQPEVVLDSTVGRLRVHTGAGPLWGATMLSPGGTSWRVALRADVECFRQLWRLWLSGGKHSANIARDL